MNHTQPLSLLCGLGVKIPSTFWGHLAALASYIKAPLSSYFPLETNWLHPRVAAEIMEKQKGPFLFFSGGKGRARSWGWGSAKLTLPSWC